MKKLMIAALVSAACCSSALAANIAIVGGKVYTQTEQGVIENGTVLIKDGKIEQVSANTEVPSGYEQVDASGKVVTPGLVGAMTSLGLVEVASWAGINDSSVENTRISNTGAAFDVSYAINPDSTLMDVSRIEGVTSAATTLSYTDYLFHGQGSIISVGAEAPLIKPRAFMVLDVSANAAQDAGGSRSALWVTLQQLFDEAKAVGDIPTPGDTWQGLNTRADLTVLKKVLSGEMPLIMEANRKSDILQVVAFKERYPQTDIVLMGAAQGWRVAEQLAQANIAVIVNPEMNLPESFDALGASMENAARLEAAGVTVAIGMETHNIRLATQHAGNAVANGLSHEAALASLTSNPARIFGVQESVGSLRTGARADVVIWSGDPLEVTEYAEQVFIDGEAVEMRSRQTDLRDRYLNHQRDDSMPPQYIPGSR